MASPAGSGSRRRIATFLAVTSLAFVPAARAAKWTPSPSDKQIQEDPAKGYSGAVYLERLEESSGEVFKTTVRAKILAKTGYDIATVDDLDSGAYDVEGRTISPSGAVTELAKKDIRRVTTLKAAGIKIEHKSFTLPALEPGCFIEYSYKQPGAFGAEGTYHVEIPFQSKYAVLRQELKTPKEFPYTSAIRQQNGVAIVMKKEGREYIYTAANAPASREEVYGLPLDERAAEVIFAYVFPGISANTPDEFWREVTKKALAPMFKKMLVKPSKLTDRLKSIPGSREQDPSARLHEIYRHVQKTIKNRRTLRAGETEPKGGWKKNDDAADAFEHGNGSDADLAAAFLSLVRADGYKGRIILVPNREVRFFRKEIPSAFQFAGRVVAVTDPRDEKRVAYFSFEHPLLGLALVPWNHTGVEGLSIDLDAETSGPALVPMPPAESNLTRRVWSVGLDESGDAHVFRISEWTGYPAFSLRAQLYAEGKAEWEKSLRENYEKMQPPGEIESVNFRNEDDPDANVQSTVRILRKGLASPLPGGRIEFAPLPMLYNSNPFTGDRRTGPILFPYPYADTDTITVAPPPGYSLEGLPAGSERTSNVGRYSVRVERGPNDTVVVTRIFTITRANSGPELYSNYRNLFDAATTADAGLSIVFKKSPAKAGAGS
jgi:hypothetical protein